jgi:hypothetical protein
VALVFHWWLYFYLEIVPERFHKINVTGAFLILLMIFTFKYLFKSYIKTNPSISIGSLVLLGSLSFLIAEIVFQAGRQIEFIDSTINERFYYFFKGVVITTLYASVISFLVAFQLKTRNTDRLLLFIGILLAIVWLLKIKLKLF